MNLPRLVLCLALLASGVCLAQESQEAPPPPPLVPAEPAQEPPPKGEIIPREVGSQETVIDRAPRYILQTLGGAASGAVLAILVAPFGVIIELPCLAVGGSDMFGQSKDSDPGCDDAIFVAMGTGAVFGMTLGVQAVGKGLGGQGRLLYTFLGAVTGAVVGGGAGAILWSGSDSRVLREVLSAAAVGLVGAVVGYELSDNDVVPVVGVTPSGGMVAGLAGRF